MQLLPTWRLYNPCVTLARHSGLRISPFREWRLEFVVALPGGRKRRHVCHVCSIFGIRG